MKIAVITMTRGDRPQLLKRCIEQVNNQTMKVFKHYIVDYPPKSNECDIIERFKVGIELAKKDGVDFIFVFEDDDFYPKNYIENTFVGGVDIVGYESTIYYHVISKGYKFMRHQYRSSLFCTGFKISALDEFIYPEKNYPFLDLKIWEFAFKNLKYYLYSEPLAIGIKHGIGVCGGKGHSSNFNYNTDEKFIKNFINEKELIFYNNLCN